MKLKAISLAATAALCAFCLGVVSIEGMPAVTVDQAYASSGLQATDMTKGTVAVQKNAKAKKKSKAAKLSKSQIKAFKKSAADFSVELFARSVASKGESANVTVSPYSVMNALAMTANGAAGKTGAEMRSVLAGGASMAQLNKSLSWYKSKLVNSKKARIRNANAIWYHKSGSLKMKKRFLNTCKKNYGAKVSGADFAKSSTVKSINSWVSKQTNKMIKQIVTQLDPADRIALVNALYFDAKWKCPFEKNEVTKQAFTTSSGEKRTVEMMHGYEQTYIESAGVRGFIKPYAKGYSYIALLPDEGVSLQDYVASLNGDTFRSLISGASQQRVRIAMPKYTLDYSNDSMEDQLAAMGMKTAFSDSANFSRMATDTSGNLKLSKVVHKTKVKVDENGTKAAAATAVIVKAGSFFDPNLKEVTLDRPFVYAIVDNTAKLPIFIGTVNTIGK